MTDKEELLARVPLFAELPRTEIAHLAATLHTVSAPDGTVLFHEGDWGEHFYIVQEGTVEVIKEMGTPDERLLDVSEPGEFLGEMSLLNRDGRRTASVRTRGAARLWEMSRAEFDELLRRQPLLVYQMTRVLSERLTNAHNKAMRDLQDKNRRLTIAYEELQAAQGQLIEKERLERELQVAHDIQMSILPRSLPRMAGFDFGARIVPARAVGGDLYDFIDFGEDALGVVVGDVSDKGVPAAIFMAQSHALLRAGAQANLPPRETLERVNAHLLEMNAEGLFVTVLYGILDRTSREFRYARGGHELPLMVNAEGEVSTLPHATGQPLGLLDNVMIDEQRVVIPVGGTLLIYTDGVTDMLNPETEAFGIERLRAALKSDAGMMAQPLCEELLETIRLFQDSAPPHDDVALVAIHAESG